jgi:Xaa-Pro aminopeptidase
VTDAARRDALAAEIRARRDALGGRLAPDEGILVYGLSGHAADLLYLSGYAPVFGAAYLLVLPSRRNARLWVPFNWDVARARRATNGMEVSAGGGTGADVCRGIAESGVRRLYVAPPETLPASFAAAMDAAAPAVEIRTLLPGIDRLRRRKSPAEIVLLREACRITEAGFAAIATEPGEGRRELDLAAAAECAMRLAGADAFGWPAVVNAGPNGGIPVAFTTARRLERHDVVIVDLGVVCRGYRTDLTRSFVVGPPDPEQQRLYDLLRRAFDAAVAAARPGVPVRRLHEIVAGTIADAGYGAAFGVRAGHGIGLESSQEWPDVETETGALEPGMTLCLEPGVYFGERGGMRIEEEIVVTESGCEPLSQAPPGLLAI